MLHIEVSARSTLRLFNLPVGMKLTRHDSLTQVRDDQGRRRFHGAFTGGYSAGYFNTVGSKEGTQCIPRCPIHPGLSRKQHINKDIF